MISKMDSKTALPTPWVATPLIESRVLSEAARCRIFLKLDNLQPSGSFKSRGIGNYILQRVAERQRSGSSSSASSIHSSDSLSSDSSNENNKVTSNIHFYAASGGNAGIACVHAARSLGYPATVVIPHSIKPTMVSKLWAMGPTDVIQHGNTIAEAQEYIQSVLLPNDPSGIFVPPFDHQDIWDGNASIMREIVDQLGEAPDVVACSVGGGGLFNGIMQVIDQDGLNNQDSNKVQVLAMETLGADSLYQSVQAGQLITLPKITSQATSLGVVRVAKKTFGYAQRNNVTSAVLTDSDAARGCCLLAEAERMMAELTVGVNVPICYNGLLQKLLGTKKQLTRESKVVIVACGGNDICIDMLLKWRQAMIEEDLKKANVVVDVARVEAPGTTTVAA